MKKTFKEYYQPDEEDFKHLWYNCEFVFDANVLLNIYLYSPNTAKDFLDLLDLIKDRIWMPYQAALEYQTNRISRIEKQTEKCVELENLLEKNELLTFLQENQRHPFIDASSIEEELKNAFKYIKSNLKEKRESYPNTINNDKLRDSITEIFEGKIGEELSKDEIEKICIEGNERFENEVPPGFEDGNKKKNKYGDLLVWKEIIRHAKEKNRPIIFITDDTKKDWWLKRGNSVIGPHPNLIKEMKSEANVDFYIYRSNKFINFANEYLRYTMNDSHLREIGDVQINLDSKIIDKDEFYSKNIKHQSSRLGNLEEMNEWELNDILMSIQIELAKYKDQRQDLETMLGQRPNFDNRHSNIVHKKLMSVNSKIEHYEDMIAHILESLEYKEGPKLYRENPKFYGEHPKFYSEDLYDEFE